MQDLINPDKMYERLGVDIIGIQVGRSLLTIADPDQEGQLLAKTAALRQRLTDDYGYIIPSCRIQDNSQLEEYEYSISIRNNVVASGFVYPGKYMVIADQWDSVKKTIPEGAIVGVEPTYQTQAYWISEEDAEAAKNVTTVEATDVIITHLGECVIKYVDEIMTDLDIEKYIEHVKSENSSQINYLMEHLTVYDIRRILVNLIREKVSIKDIGFIFMKLCEFVIYTTETEALSKKLRVALARRICLQYVDTNNALYALDLSSSIEDILKNSIANTEFGTMFLLEPQQSQEIVEKIANKLMKAEKNKEHKPVILVSPKIRAALYEFLVKHIPTVVVLSYAELVETIKVEIIDTIE